ncbi:MAG: DUF624 domain-containing protein [Acidimicrobiia bacterium]|nr:DUF624 domain-containing protein [Acidimicrobiia bacterium]
MSGALRAALAGWWREIFVLTGLNLLWTLAAFSIVALPPATAAMFYVARQVLANDFFTSWHTFWQPFRRYWWAAWRWGFVFFALAGIATANLWIYRDFVGPVWTILRWVWATFLIAWVILNLFFWPLWFVEEEAHRTLRATWRNALAFVAANPLPALVVTLVVVLLGAASLLFGVPLGVLFMSWTALLATATLAAYLPRVRE